MHPPKVFISATSGDLRGIRQVVKEALLTINCHPVEQTNSEPDWRTVGGMLRAKIEGCQALVHLAGMRYGTEPDPATLPPGTARRSYTQMEYHLGCQLHEERGDAGFRVYTFVCPEGFPYDPEPDAEAEEKRALQRAHRTLLIDSPRRYEKPGTSDDIQMRILALQEQVLSLQQQHTEVKHEVRGLGQKVLAALAIVLVLIVGVFGTQWWMKRDADKIIAGQKEITEGQKAIIEGPKITTAGIRKQILLGSEKKRDRDLAEADAAEPAKREKLREAALDAHTSRISRLDELAQSFTELEGRADTTAVFREMARILEQEGVDMALAYVAEQKGGILDRVRKRRETEQAQTRTELQPLLTAASLKASSGQTVAARAAFHELLALDPTWPAALESAAWFLNGQTIENKYHGTLAVALADAEEAHTLATRLHTAAPASPTARRLLSSTHTQMGDVLLKRGQDGDAAKVQDHYTQSIELAEALLKANPGSAMGMRGVTVSLSKLGDFLVKRGQPGDPDKALEYFTRSLEMDEARLKADPGSAQATGDVAGSLEKLGGFLAKRGQPGDADKALGYFTRDLALSEALLKANPGSTEVTRDVPVSLEKLGDFLAKRGQPGDTDKALGYLTRSLDMREALLKANPGWAQAARDVSVSLGKLGDLLATRGQPGDTDKALGYLTRDLELSEALLKANPGSAEATRDVSISLYKLGDFLAKCGQPGDADKALGSYTRSLELAEALLKASPGSAQATRDVSVSLMKLGDILATRGQPGDADKALDYFTRSVDLAEALLKANPGSAEATRDVAVSHSKMGTFAHRRGDAKDAEKHYRASYDVLRPAIERGMAFDPTIVQLYEALKAQFAK
jgi:tetratricopeptide (TPR) repeat protein